MAATYLGMVVLGLSELVLAKIMEYRGKRDDN
jgi:hypothetical protein